MYDVNVFPKTILNNEFSLVNVIEPQLVLAVDWAHAFLKAVEVLYEL